MKDNKIMLVIGLIVFIWLSTLTYFMFNEEISEERINYEKRPGCLVADENTDVCLLYVDVWFREEVINNEETIQGD